MRACAANADGVPRCEACGAADAARRRAVRRAAPAARSRARTSLCVGAELLLCIGSSLEVHPVASLPMLTRDRWRCVAIVTQGPTPLDEIAAVRLDGDVVAELPALLGALEQSPSGSPSRRGSAGV